MSTNILDILINEISIVLGISPDEVKKKFTKEQLDELLENSLCEPVDESGIAMESIENLPCNDTGTPLDLPPISDDDLNSFDDLIKEAEKAGEDSGTHIKKCVDDVEKINDQIQKDIDLYNDYNTLLQKLIEYRDNYAPIAIYFEERIKEANKILFAFGTIIELLRKYEADKRAKESELSSLKQKVSDIKKTYEKTTLPESAKTLITQYENSQKNVTLEINNLTKQITSQEKVLKDEEKKFPVFDLDRQGRLLLMAIANIGNTGPQVGAAATAGSTNEAYYLNTLLQQSFSGNPLSGVNDKLKEYAEGLTCIPRETSDNLLTFNTLISRPIVNFSLEFFKLNFIQTQKERFDRATAARNIENIDFPIKNSPLLKTKIFFESSSNIFITELTEPITSNRQPYNDPTGIIYTNYYNLFRDPINNFFTLEERGLTNNANLIDPKLSSNPGAAEKRENGSLYWISDIEKMQAFFQEFDARFEIRKQQKREQIITPAQQTLRDIMNPIAKFDVTILLALGGVNKQLRTDRIKRGRSNLLETVVQRLQTDSSEFILKLSELDKEIIRIKARVEELKPSPDKVKKQLKATSPECFGNIDQVTSDCGDTKSLLGSDPFFTKTIKGTDPTLPNFAQLCYWKEFAKLATLMGLIPLPNIPNFTELRYWPVGFIIPYTGGIIKIPLPIIWLPLVCISTPLGVIVLFLTVNGIFISPVIFFISSKGFKQFIITVRGSSKKFGYDGADSSIKPGIQFPVALKAIKEKADRISKEAALGKLFNLTDKEKESYLKATNILNKAKAEAQKTGNPNKLKKISKESANLNESVSNLGKFEKMQNFLNKKDTAEDTVENVKRAIHQRINDLGKPLLSKSDQLKSKITERQNTLNKKLISQLENNDVDSAKRTRLEILSDGIAYSDKVAAIKQDVSTYFNKIKFPKIHIPKDRSLLEPKKNAIIEFLVMVKDYSNIYKTQFIPKEHLVVKTWLSTNLAKIKPSLKEDGRAISGNQQLDVVKDLDKIKKYLRNVNKKVIDAASGKGDSIDYAKQREEISNLEKQAKSENDPIKKKQLNKKVEGAKIRFGVAFDNQMIRQAFAMNPAAIASINGIKVDFNPFSPCCKKKPFSLDLSAISPSLAILSSAGNILNGPINSLDPSKLKALIGGKNKISINELMSVYLSLINKNIPTSLRIPNPSLNLVTYASTFSGIFLSLIEPKAPITVLQPKFPVSIPINLNILKPVLLPLLLKFIDDILPDGPKSANLPESSGNSPKDVPSNSTISSSQQLNQNALSPTGLVTPLSNNVKISPDIKIIDCYPVKNETFSPIGTKGPSVDNENSISEDPDKGKDNTHTVSNVIINSSKDIHIQFQHMDTDFMTINANDLLAIIKNFIELKLDDLKNLLEPFYKILNIIGAAKGTNLNIIEAAQFKIPPYGPAVEVLFSAITLARVAAPKAALTMAFDTDKIKSGVDIMESSLKPLMSSPLPYLAVIGAGAVDSIIPSLKVLDVDSASKSVSTKDIKAATFALRQIHPLLNQDDTPPWERLSLQNLLFLLFLDEFLSNAADQVGFFRTYL